MASQVSEKVLIWDLESLPPDGNYIKVFWRQFVSLSAKSCISIPSIIEENAEELRCRFLECIYELGELRIGCLRVIDYLELRAGFSYWWMTLLVEKCNYSKSPLINDAVRFYAFEFWIRNNPEIKSIKLVTANHALIQSLESWCETQDIRFEYEYSLPSLQLKSKARLLFEKLPHIIQAGLWLSKYLIDRWPLCGVGVGEWRNGKSQATFISYLFNLQPKAASEGSFESAYWTELPHVLGDKGIRSNWLHMYVKSSDIPSAGAAASILRKFNANYNNQQVHVCLDSFLSAKVIFAVALDYFKVRKKGKFITAGIRKSFGENRQDHAIKLLPLFAKDLESSLFGIEAIKNLLNLKLFENAFSVLPNQTFGVYLQEGQGWETGMIHAWKEGDNGQLVGYPHSTVRFWDLRYFFDTRSYAKSRLSLPRPHCVAVSGDAVRNAYLCGGYPSEDLFDVEALRYLSLEVSDKNSGDIFQSQLTRKRLLILGEYSSINTALQMSLLIKIADGLSNIDLTVKPHPACPINKVDYPELNFNLTNQPISELLKKFDIAFSSSVTSAAVDAYSAGLQVIAVSDPTTLNMSPLRGVAGVRFVSSADELREALAEMQKQNNVVRTSLNFYNTDSSLPRWRQLMLGCLKGIKYELL